jgi:hypothetical protein
VLHGGLALAYGTTIAIACRAAWVDPKGEAWWALPFAALLLRNAFRDFRRFATVNGDRPGNP